LGVGAIVVAATCGKRHGCRGVGVAMVVCVATALVEIVVAFHR
jgi:hypothetical protein